jgi:hypothetical protein
MFELWIRAIWFFKTIVLAVEVFSKLLFINR